MTRFPRSSGTAFITPLRAAFRSDNSPEEIAASLAGGIFYAALPTAGTALVLFPFLAYRYERVNPAALAAALVLFNPPVKWAVYGASLVVGSLIFGIHLPIDTAAGVSGILWDAGPELLLRQLTGNLLLGTLFAVVGYYSVLAYMDLKRTDIST